MHRWTPYPFLRITTAFILGIIATRIGSFHIWTSYLLCGTAGLFILCFLVRKKIELTWIGHVLLGVVFFIGMYLTHAYSQLDQRELLDEQFSKATSYLSIVDSYPTKKEKYFVYEINATGLLVDSVYQSIDAKIQLYEKRTEQNDPSFAYGDQLIIEGHPFLIQKPKNPHEFNYSAFMADQNIFFQQFPKAKQITKVASYKANPLLTAVYRLRQYFEQTILSKVDGKDEQAITMALLLGIKDYLDQDVKQAFAAAGAMHVLAVSGLHVGVIYLILIWLFKPIKNSFVQSYILPVLSLIVLWLYAMLTGFSPSIFRAVTMFSVVILGKALQRTPNIYNFLCVSALILLLVNPNYLFAVGFQLSYLAVIGIVYFYDIFHKMWAPKTWLMGKVWTLVCISVAAQIATSPISIYYFHQFPSYFIFSNLIVIPLSFLIMVLGISILAFGQWAISDYLGFVLENLVWFLNASVEFIFKRQWSVQDWLYLSLSQTIFIYVAIVLLCAFLYFKKMPLFWLTTISLLIISFQGTASLIQQSLKKEAIFYATRQNQAIDLVDGLHTELYTLDTISNLDLLKFQIDPNRLSSHLPAVNSSQVIQDSTRLIDDFASLYVYDGFRYLHIFKKPPLDQIKFRWDTDYLVVSNNSLDDYAVIEDYIQLQTLMIDTSNDWNTKKNLKSQARDKGVKVILLDEQAAIISRH